MPTRPVSGIRAAIVESLKVRGIEYRVVTFDEAGAKDLGEFLASGATKGDVTRRIGWDWVRTGISDPSSPDDDYDPDAPKPTI